MANPGFLNFSSITGNIDGALDSRDTTLLLDTSHAYVNTGSEFFAYVFDDDSVVGASPPDVVAPVTGPGRWILTWRSGSALSVNQAGVEGAWTFTDWILFTAGVYGINFQDGILKRPSIIDYREPVYPKGNISGASVDFDKKNSQVQEATLIGDVTSSTISNLAASGNAGSLILYLNVGGTAYSFTWDTAIDWGEIGVPDISTINKRYRFLFTSIDSGTKKEGVLTGVFD